jgi:tRNA wybutosine-synthesizing protein 5
MFCYVFSSQRKPLVLEGIDLGSCTSKWTVDYLSQVGGTKEVKIHVAAVPQMDFISKNFVYRYFFLRFTLGTQITF